MAKLPTGLPRPRLPGFTLRPDMLPNPIRIGRRHDASLVYDDALTPHRMDVVDAADGPERLLCLNAERTLGLTSSDEIANVVAAGWLEGRYYYQVSSAIPTEPRVRARDSANAAALARGFCGLVAGLAYLHHGELVHGALSPACVVSIGEAPRLGELWWVHATNGESLTPDFSPAYRQSLDLLARACAAPEILSGSRPSRRADLYALGATCYALATGQPPTDPFPTAEEARAALLRERPDLDRWLVWAVGGLLVAAPDERFGLHVLETAREEHLRRVALNGS